jgi:hypothetical protein
MASIRTERTLTPVAFAAAVGLWLSAACSDKPSASDGLEQCSGPYTVLCDDVCVATQANPDHCGGCGTTCVDGEACFSGQCVTSCGAGLEMCGRQCVDFDTDSNNCGQCDSPCGDQRGCSLGECVESMAFERDDNLCLGGGPAIVIEDPTRGDRCSGQLRQELFSFAVCSCDRAVFGGDFHSDGFDSVVGPYAPDLLDGPIGMNDHLSVGGRASFDGSATVAGQFEAEEDLLVSGDLSVGGNLLVAGGATIDGDAVIGGEISASTLSVGGRLEVAEGTDVDDFSFGQLVEGDGVIDPPCPCDSIPDVAAIVSARRDHNDNAEIGLDASLLATHHDSIQHLALPCGHFFLNGSDIGTNLTIVVHGRTAIYINGTFTTSSDLRILPAPGAELDLFIDGQITAEGTLTLGSPNYPAATRIYIDDQVAFEGDVQLNGYILGEDHITLEGNFEVFGGFFAGNLLSAEGNTTVHYDHQVREAIDPELSAGTCPDPEAED